MSRLMLVLVAVLVVLGVGAAVGHFWTEPYNPGFLEHPVVTRTHVVLGGLYLALAPLQLLRGVRRRALGYHRWAGRVLVGVGVVVGLSALFLGLVVPMSGDPERVVIGLFGTLFLASLALGLVRARQRRIAAHREWMLRAFAIGLSVATMRLLFVPTLVIIGNPSPALVAWLSVGSFTLAFALHAGITEWWIRRTRRSARRHRVGAPTARVPQAAGR